MSIESLKSIFKWFPTVCIKCSSPIFFEKAWKYTKNDGKFGYICVACACERKAALRTVLHKEYPNAFKKGKVKCSTNLPDPFPPPPAEDIPPPEKLKLKKATEDMLLRVGVLNPTETETQKDIQ